MLTIQGHGATRDCGGLARRDFLRVGSLGLAGLSLPWLFARGSLGAEKKTFLRDKSVVLLFLCGGPSHIETFDPNMSSPAPWCSLTGETKTAIPGVTFGSTYPLLAERARQLAIVRSYSPHQIADHALAIRHVLRGGDPVKNGASMGAVASRLMGGTNPATGMPRYASLIQEETDSQYREDEQRMRIGSGAGTLGAASAPFSTGGEGELAGDMRLSLPLERLNDRRELARSLDQLNRKVDASGEMAAADRFTQQAVDVVLGGKAREALDLTKEDPKLLARYDTSHFKTGWLEKRTSTIGRQLLLARRLCEAGCGFVTVGYAGWDNHGNDKHPGVVEGMHHLGTPLDKAVSAFLDDVQERGLSEKILLVITGEFGRTPRIQQNGGRDHWPGLCSLVFAGGGLKMGQVIGKSARTADVPASDPVALDQVLGTIMHSLFDLGRLRITANIPRELVHLVESSKRIEQLF